MDKNFADDLWVKLCHIHGKLGIPEVCRLMIYALFIRYIDMEKEKCSESYDIKYSVGYLALTYGKMVTAESLEEYVKKAESALLHGDGMIAAEFRKLLDKVEVSHMQAIFEMIGSAGFESKSQLYEVASLLLDKLPYVHGNLRAGTFVNLSLCRLEGKLLDCQEGMTVYDGFCGYGLSVNEAANGNGTVYMQDANESVVAISAVMALLKGNQIGSVGRGDSLVSPMACEKYDRIVCEPPLLPKCENTYRSKILEGNILYPEILDDKSLALRHVLAHLKDNGMAVMLAPKGILFSPGSSRIREKLVGVYLDAIIRLPAGAIPNMWNETVLLVLKKNTGRDTSCLLIDAKEYFKKVDKNQYVISDEDISRIVDIYKNREMVGGKAFIITKDMFENENIPEYLLQDLEDTFMLADVAICKKKYERLTRELAELDRQLETVRGRFIDGTNALSHSL